MIFELCNGMTVDSDQVKHPDDVFVGLDDFVHYYQNKFRIALDRQPRRILEIGVRAGYSAHAFMTACPEATYIGIDLETKESGGYGQWWTEHAGRLLAGRNAFILITDSHLIKNLYGKFDLVHIDGDHSLPGAYQDMLLGWHVLAGGGRMVVDDYTQIPDVTEAVDLFIRRHACRHELIESKNGDMILWRGI